jgi:hypothetical protein
MELCPRLALQCPRRRTVVMMNDERWERLNAIFHRIRAHPRFQTALQRLYIQIYDRVRSARRTAELK